MKQKRAEDSGAKASKESKRAWVEGSDNSDFIGFNMGVQVTQDLSVMLLGIEQEMAMQLEIMWQMLQVSMGQLEVLWVRGVEFGSQVEAVCQVGSGQLVVRTQEARLRSVRVQEMELRGCALEALEQSQGPSGSREKPESGQSRVQVKFQRTL